MSHRFVLRIASICIPVLTLLALIVNLPTASFTSSANAQGGSRLYLPMVLHQIPRAPMFGMNVTAISQSRGIDAVANAGTTWVRSSRSLLWKDVERQEGGGYDWNAPSVQALKADMIEARARNLNFIVIVHGSPRWATQPYQADCAPINPSKYGRFASFMAAAAREFGKEPYGVKFWEIGNEPDAYIFTSDSGFGCWGVTSDTKYYGGRAYGAMLNAIYPAIKGANPDAKVLNGGLLLDSQTAPSSRFFSGILAAGAGKSFDILNYHSYGYLNGMPDGTLGKTDWKVGFLRKAMADARVPEKPMINTEAALLCGETCVEQQADALPRMFVRARRDGLLGYMWYIYDGRWGKYDTALVDIANPSIQRPAFQAYKHAAATIGSADYVGPMSGLPSGVEGYQFRQADKTILVFWSNGQTNVSLPVAAGRSVQCTDRSGAAILCRADGGRLNIASRVNATYVTIR